MKGLQELRGRFRGALLRPARRLRRGPAASERGHDRRPVLIARCAGADDVAVAVRFARGTSCGSRSGAAGTPSPATAWSTGA